jgi:hypothetical protein
MKAAAPLDWRNAMPVRRHCKAAMSAKSLSSCSTFGQSLSGPSASRREVVGDPESPDFLGETASGLGTMTATITSPA